MGLGNGADPEDATPQSQKSIAKEPEKEHA
jgi:hypothetical protein